MATKATASDRAATRFQFVGGKGGVGKTTCAAAFAVDAASRGERVLVASTDPAPSLGDAFKIPLAATPRRLPLRSAALFAVEIDARASLRRWIAERRDTLETIAVEGTWLDRDDVARLLRLSLPGVDELAALLEIARLSESGRFDLVVVDTAPTGHTLRMLAMPETLFAISGVFDRMREKQRVVQEALRGSYETGVEDRLIAELAGTARDLWTLLRDATRSTMAWVTLPEPMAVAEASSAIDALRETGIGVQTIVANRVTPPPPGPCGHCDARIAFERKTLSALPTATRLARVMARDVEPRGLPALTSIAGELANPADGMVRRGRSRTWRAARGADPVSPASLAGETLRLVLLGGKGGVGKTTCAAALAVDAAKRGPNRRVLLISTDPAHSLSDVFGEPLSDEAAPVTGGPPNLRVRQLDPSRVMRSIEERYAQAIDAAFDTLRGGGSFDAAHDRAIMQSLIDLAPPGLDELAAILEITDTIVSEPAPWDMIVMDTAPTGHALRLLEMPALVQDWTRALMSILLKYQGIARIGELGTLLLKLSKGIRRLRELLSDPRTTGFIVVTRPAALPRLETVRLVRRLARLRIPVPAVIINAVGRGECARCARIAAAQAREIGALRHALSPRSQPRHLVVAGAEIPPPAGAKALSAWGRRAWYALGESRAAAISSNP